jgi:hypothetical protein
LLFLKRQEEFTFIVHKKYIIRRKLRYIWKFHSMCRKFHKHVWSHFSYICKGQLKEINFLQNLESGKFLPVPRSDEERIFAWRSIFHRTSMLFYSCFVEMFARYWSCNLQRSAWPSKYLPVRTVGFNFHALTPSRAWLWEGTHVGIKLLSPKDIC